MKKSKGMAVGRLLMLAGGILLGLSAAIRWRQVASLASAAAFLAASLPAALRLGAAVGKAVEVQRSRA